jgi:hypothetical protein
VAGSGTFADDAAPAAGTVAIGDAGARLLARAGWAVRSVLPQHGRVLRCLPTQHAPWPAASPFAAARYASLALEDQPTLPGWEVWLTDEARRPLALVHPDSRWACLLLRPDSLLSQPQALQLLAAALDAVADRPKTAT